VGDVALLIIDMLNDFVLQGSPLEVPDTRGIITPIQDKIQNARGKSIPIIYICDSHEKNDKEFVRMGWPPHALAGSMGAQVIDLLKPSSHDTIILKKSYSGFFETDLDKVLVHCNAGIGRSPSIVVCYLYEIGFGLEEAVKLVKRKRPDALPHRDLRSAIMLSKRMSSFKK